MLETASAGEGTWEQPALRILRENWGPSTSMGVAEPLGGSDRSNVRRVTLGDGDAGAPETVVVKQAGGVPILVEI